MKLADLSGMRFERALVVDRAPNKSEKDTNARWNCVCDCGKRFVTYGQDLRRGKVKSCGCLTRSTIGERTKEVNTTHGLSKTAVYRMWRGMLNRCNDPEKTAYFGKVKVCERWQSFENFLMDMGPPPEGKTLDRISSFGDYSPENCRWATPKEQANNRRKPNITLEHRGMKLTLVDWAKVLEISYQTIYGRWKDGRSVDEILRKEKRLK